ncbi:MAG: DUF2887 domain-containing protein [Methylococcaceae bacterium]|nr:DUF2887 domain-containing protein [Methylococcaceae bacterium]
MPQLHRIYLEDYKIRKGISPTLDLLSLISCTKQKTMTVARDLVNSYDDIDAEILDFIETILVYKLPTLSREEIKEMLGLDDVKLKNTRFYQEIAEEEGKNILKRLLTLRFGELPEQVKQRLETANTEQVEQWTDALFDALSLDDLLKKTIH